MFINTLTCIKNCHDPLEFALGNSSGTFYKSKKQASKKINYEKVIDKLISVARLLCPENEDNNLQLTGGASLALQTKKNMRPIYDFDFTANNLDKIKNVIAKFSDQNILHQIDLRDERIVKGMISLGKNGGEGPFIQFSVTQRKQEILNLNDNSDLIASQELLDTFYLEHGLSLQDALDCKDPNKQESAGDANTEDFSEISDSESYLNSEDTSDIDDSLQYTSDPNYFGNPSVICEDVKILGTDKLTIINPLTTANVKSGIMRRKNKYEHDLADFKIAMNLLKEQGKISKDDYTALCARNDLRNHLKQRLNKIRDSKLRQEAKNMLCTSQASNIVHPTTTPVTTNVIKIESEQGQ
jgi:hypothetical protein